MAWLDADDDSDDWVEVMNYDGDLLGWIKHQEAIHLNMPLNLIEVPPLYMEHPTILHHAKMTYEMGLLKADGESGLSEVQMLLLTSYILKNQEAARTKHVTDFEENLLINNPTAYKMYKENKEQQDPMDVDGVMVQERVPENIEEFLATLSAFTDEEEEYDDEVQEDGWLDSMLSSEEMEGMGE